MLRPLRLAITSGDAHGIGPEVVAKSLYKLGPQKNLNFYLWRSTSFPKRDLRLIQRKFNLIKCSSWEDALSKTPSSKKDLLDICTNINPALWVEEAARACFFKHLDAMTTAPLSKPTIAASGLADLGHTEILKRVSQTKKAYMVFLGKYFNVFLATGHLSISQLKHSLTEDVIKDALESAKSFHQKFINKGSIAVLGINPHAGDGGLIGDEEISFVSPLIQKPFTGPLVPDSAFVRSMWSKCSLYIAMYHDQGLIPFKTVHGHDGVHLTWGLPFIRTSVDHGTAFDIAGKNKADASSMLAALKLAVELAFKQAGYK